MFRRIISLLFFLSFINAQIALPTFHAVHKPHTAETSSLYDFTSQTFTNCDKTGKDGPTLSDCTSDENYSDSWTDNTSYFNVSDGIQSWTVPSTATYTIEVWGASAEGDRGGNGAKMKGDFDLEQNDVIKIIVGQMGDLYSNSNNNSAGGGGGTFVWDNSIGTPSSSNYPLIVAGGGGGGSGTTGNRTGIDGSITTCGTDGTATDPGSGGTNGDGGGAGGTSTTNSFDGVGGAGWYGNGNNSGGAGDPPLSVANGGTGGLGYIYANPDPSTNGVGGFGGGGGNGAFNYNGTGGGGGGYSGGGGGGNTSSSRGSGGGGGSYNAGSNKYDSSTLGYNTGYGKIIITKN